MSAFAPTAHILVSRDVAYGPASAKVGWTLDDDLTPAELASLKAASGSLAALDACYAGFGGARAAGWAAMGSFSREAVRALLVG